MEEAAEEIETLENKLENQRVEFDEQILQVETELSLCKLEENNFDNLILMTEVS